MPVANLALQIAIQAMNRGWADMDNSITVKLQEEAAGVEVRAPSSPGPSVRRKVYQHASGRIASARSVDGT